ncbi:putative non-specific serine/threonine protein kinase [Helianthus debilis subsp. tardiflorus]
MEVGGARTKAVSVVYLIFLANSPKALDKLTNLTTLDLSSNMLFGEIPMELGGSLKLQGLYLGIITFTDGILDKLCQPRGLVKLTGNKLSGLTPAT